MADEQTPPAEPSSDPPPTMPAMPPPPTTGDLRSRSVVQPAPSGLSMGQRRTGSAPESGVRRQGGILMMAGAVVVLASLPLPRLTVSGSGITHSVNGMSGVALWLLFICGFAFMRGYSAIKPTAFRSSLPVLSGVFIIWAIYDRWKGIDATVKLAAATPGVTVSAGVGFWITCFGGALVVAGSLILQFVKPQQS